MIKPARPTLLCLGLLVEDWNSPDHKLEAQSGDFENVSHELHRLDHPLIHKAAEDFTVESSLDADIKREGISDLKNPMWWKVKIGRWRGAVYQDESGQAWLVAGGYRRGKEATDFYQWFMAEVKAHGPEQFLPTTDDRRRLSDELAEARFIEWEHRLQADARDLTARARLEGLLEYEIVDPDGDALGTFSVAYTEEVIDDDVVGDAYFEFICSDWAQLELLTWAETVMCLAIDPHEQTWRPTNVPSGRGYSLVMDAAETGEFFRAVQGPPLDPGVSVPGAHAHWTHRGRLTEATILGEAVKGLCGRWFVPRQDHEHLEHCRQCEIVYNKMQDD